MPRISEKLFSEAVSRLTGLIVVFEFCRWVATGSVLYFVLSFVVICNPPNPPVSGFATVPFAAQK
jgi:hypothetical protein